jgi:glutamate racemase
VSLDTSLNRHAPIGVFDSGVGGLSILQALQRELPNENFVYVADSAHAPYGERDAAFVLERAKAIWYKLRDEHHVKALVIACNTATALAIQQLRTDHPEVDFFGVEPAVKPAAALSQTKRVGVMATPATLGSDKFLQLLQSLQGNTEFVLQGCEGLADAIEQQCQEGGDAPVQALCQKYVHAMGVFGNQPGEIDTLVLGCTHYPFALPILRDLVGDQVHILETGLPVARQVKKVLAERGLLAVVDMSAGSSSGEVGKLTLLATGDAQSLHRAASMWLPSR